MKSQIHDSDLKRLRSLKGSQSLIIYSSSKEIVHHFTNQFLKEYLPDAEVQQPEYERQTKNKVKTSKGQLIKWNEPQNAAVPENDSDKSILYIYSLNDPLKYNIRNWKKILEHTRIDKEIIQRIKSSGTPVLLVKLIQDKIINQVHEEDTIKLTTNKNSEKKSKEYLIRVSHLITSEYLQKFQTASDLRKYIHARLKFLEINKSTESHYGLNHFFKNKQIPQELISRISPEKIESEINHLDESAKILTSGDLAFYITSGNRIPNTMLEIGRLRELTFRKVHEGTGLTIDLDNYDPFYKQLFVWDAKTKSILGACRIGEGHKIIPMLGKKGMYISSLFKIEDGFIKTLLQTVELGRFFIIPEHQKSNLILLQLWKATLKYIRSNPSNKYVIGPVSISQEYSNISRLMIMDYLRKFHFHKEYAKFIRPRKAFRIFKNKNSKEIILRNFEQDLHTFDNFISEIEFYSNKLPVLLKQYMKQNAKVLSFNKDPKFQNVLDALVFIELETLPKQLIKMLQRPEK